MGILDTGRPRWGPELVAAGVGLTPHGGGDNSLGRIEARLDELRGAVRNVAEYVLTNPWETRGIGILELARRAGVSENTVTRFCLAIGYSGYREFSTELASTLGRLFAAAYAAPPEVTDAVPGDDEAFQVVRNVFALEMQSLSETLQRLDRKAIEAAVDALHTARRVLLVGMGATAPVASAAAYRLALLGIDATWTADPYMLTAQANLVRSGDVALGISYHGKARLIVEALKIARGNGATTIALTTAPASALAKSADICLTIASSASLFAGRQFAARVAGVLLVEALIAAGAWVRHRGVPAALLRTIDVTQRLLDYD